MRFVAPLALATTVTGCFSWRVTAGVGTSKAGPSLELGVAAGFGADRSTTTVDSGVGVGGKAGATTSAVATYQREAAPGWKLGEDTPPKHQLWLGLRTGVRGPIKDATRDDVAFVAGAGVMYLHVLEYSDAEFKSNCVFFGMGSETINGVGVAGWVDAQLGGDPDMGKAMATVALVYQHQSYLRGNDCGD